MALFSHLGHGIGLRPPHYPRVVDGTARVDWFEVISENFMIPGGRPLHVLEKARALAPVVLHGVSMNLGGTDPLNERHLGELERLIRRFEPAWVSSTCAGGPSDATTPTTCSRCRTPRRRSRTSRIGSVTCRNGSAGASWSRTSRATSPSDTRPCRNGPFSAASRRLPTAASCST